MTGVARATDTVIGIAMNNTASSASASASASELLSALVDGDLAGAELDTALIACRQQGSAALASWSAYHLIGEVLRSPSAAANGAYAQFLRRFLHRLEEEPAYNVADRDVVSTITRPENFANSHKLLKKLPVRGRAANDESFRWKLVAGFASLAAVSAIAWNASGFLAPETAPQMARGTVPEQVLVASPQGLVVRDARLEELLAAHRQLGARSALQAPSGFLQNATFDPTQCARR